MEFNHCCNFIFFIIEELYNCF